MLNDFMWQKFFTTGKVDDYLIYKNADTPPSDDKDEINTPLATV